VRAPYEMNCERRPVINPGARFKWRVYAHEFQLFSRLVLRSARAGLMPGADQRRDEHDEELCAFNYVLIGHCFESIPNNLRDQLKTIIDGHSLRKEAGMGLAQGQAPEISIERANVL
jgi:hypothetical protein